MLVGCGRRDYLRLGRRRMSFTISASLPPVCIFSIYMPRRKRGLPLYLPARRKEGRNFRNACLLTPTAAADDGHGRLLNARNKSACGGGFLFASSASRSVSLSQFCASRFLSGNKRAAGRRRCSVPLLLLAWRLSYALSKAETDVAAAALRQERDIAARRRFAKPANVNAAPVYVDWFVCATASCVAISAGTLCGGRRLMVLHSYAACRRAASDGLCEGPPGPLQLARCCLPGGCAGLRREARKGGRGRGGRLSVAFLFCCAVFSSCARSKSALSPSDGRAVLLPRSNHLYYVCGEGERAERRRLCLLMLFAEQKQGGWAHRQRRGWRAELRLAAPSCCA